MGNRVNASDEVVDELSKDSNQSLKKVIEKTKKKKKKHRKSSKKKRQSKLPKEKIVEPEIQTNPDEKRDLDFPTKPPSEYDMSSISRKFLGFQDQISKISLQSLEKESEEIKKEKEKMINQLQNKEPKSIEKMPHKEEEDSDPLLQLQKQKKNEMRGVKTKSVENNEEDEKNVEKFVKDIGEGKGSIEDISRNFTLKKVTLNKLVRSRKGSIFLLNTLKRNRHKSFKMHFDIVTSLIKQQEEEGEWGFETLFYIMQSKVEYKEDLMKALLKQEGINLNVPLYQACENNCYFVVKKILSSSTKVNVNYQHKEQKDTPLHVVARLIGSEDQYKMMKLLLRHGADPFLENANGETAMECVIDEKCIKLLMKVRRRLREIEAENAKKEKEKKNNDSEVGKGKETVVYQNQRKKDVLNKKDE